MNSAEIHAEQQQRNLARFGTETFPGGRGEWPDFPEMLGAPADVRLDELHVMSNPELPPTTDDGWPVDDYPLWEG